MACVSATDSGLAYEKSRNSLTNLFLSSGESQAYKVLDREQKSEFRVITAYSGLCEDRRSTTFC